MIKNILVTGSGGIIGQHICDILTSTYPHIHFVKFKGDLCQPDDIEGNFQDNAFDAIIHLASLVAVTEVDADPAKAYAINVGGTANLLQSAVKHARQDNRPLPYFFQASSAHIYASQDHALLETSPIGSHTLYGRTKYMSEQLALDICQKLDMSCLVGRIFSFYDARQKPPFLYPNIIKRLIEEDLDQPFELYGADSLRDMSKASDIADMILKLVMKQKVGTLNIASGNATKISDFVQSLTDKKLNIVPKGTPNYLTADITLLNKALK